MTFDLLIARLAVALVLLVPTVASAQQRTIYDAQGRPAARVTTDSQGSQIIYDAAGRVTGRSASDSAGTTTFYDASGRNVGTVTKQREKP